MESINAEKEKCEEGLRSVMTIKIITEGGGIVKAQITTVTLPDTLAVGAAVTGTFVLTNIGDTAGKLRLLFTTVWDNKNYEAISSTAVAVNGTLTVTLSAGLIIMPNADAVINMQGQHETSPGSGTWTTDDTKSH